MKKSIIAIAVSTAALASVPTFAAEGSTVDIYGNIQYAYTNSDDKGDQAKDNGSTIGLKGETKINDDLTAFFKYELEADADEKGDVTVGLDQAFVGLNGGFGKVQVGSFDSIYNNAIQDSVDQFEQLGFLNSVTTTEGDTIAYFSPSFGGFEFQASAQVKGSAEGTETTKVNGNDVNLTNGTAFTAVVKYTVGDLVAALGYDDLNNYADNRGTDTTGLSVGYNFLNNLNVTAKFETTKDLQDVLGLSARYGYGAGDIYASAQAISPEADGENDYNEYGVGMTYDLASNVYVYGEVGSFENASNSNTDTQTAVGVYYGF